LSYVWHFWCLFQKGQSQAKSAPAINGTCSAIQPCISCPQSLCSTPSASLASGTGFPNSSSRRACPPQLPPTYYRWVSPAGSCVAELSPLLFCGAFALDCRNRLIVSSLLMAGTTYMILQREPVWLTSVLVFLAGAAMAPVFPTTIAIVARLFKEQSATAIGFAITCGFSGLISSPLIGWLSGSDPLGVGRGLLIVPVLSMIIFAIHRGCGGLQISQNLSSRRASPAPARFVSFISAYFRDKTTPGAPAWKAASTAAFTSEGCVRFSSSFVGMSMSIPG